jgi:hypothetical protein
MFEIIGILYGLEIEVTLCIIIADVFNHSSQTLHIIRKKSTLYVIAQQVAQQSAEILMARIAEERSAIGKHSNEAA